MSTPSLLNSIGKVVGVTGATTIPDKTFADLDFSALEQVVALNIHITVLPTLVFPRALLTSGSSARAATRFIYTTHFAAGRCSVFSGV